MIVKIDCLKRLGMENEALLDETIDGRKLRQKPQQMRFLMRYFCI
jgi:hypothetical protein